jgi:hypothetical protein
MEPLEQLINKYEGFHWNQDYDKAFDLLKQKLSTAPIMTYPNLQGEFMSILMPLQLR